LSGGGLSVNLSAMELVLKRLNDASHEEGRDLSVVISFADAVTAARADGVLQLLGRKLKHAEGRLFHQWWNLEVLAFNSFRELAALEAATADMIIIGLPARQELPETLAAWVKRWLDLRQGRPGALVAVLDDGRKTVADAAGGLVQLKQAAAAGDMDFFVTQARERKVARADCRASEVVRQFVLTRKRGIQTRWAGEERISAAACGQ